MTDISVVSRVRTTAGTRRNNSKKHCEKQQEDNSGGGGGGGATSATWRIFAGLGLGLGLWSSKMNFTSMQVSMFYFFNNIHLMSDPDFVRSRLRLGKHQDSRENKTNWFPERPDIKCFVIFLDFHFNSNKRITGANQNS